MPISSSETPSSAAQDFGPYFFAWTDEGDAFDPAIHTRFDDDIFGVNIEQQEGDFAGCTLSIKNPRIGLLAPGRQIWAWVSWWNGFEAIPLFKGRLVGLPTDLDQESVSISFIARPSNFATQKAAVAEALKVRPFWDAIWFDATTRDNPDNVLESRPEAWHIDRVTHVVSSSNIIDGEDGTAAFDEDQVFYDSVHVSYSQNPLRSVTMVATVSWDQVGSGSIPHFSTGSNLMPAFAIESYTGTGLAEAWPQPGQSIGGGWSWSDAAVTVSGAIPDSLIGEIQYKFDGTSFYVDGGFDTSIGTFEDLPDGTHIGFSYHVAIPNIQLVWRLSLGWEANRRKTENLTFTLTADVQDIITLPEDGEALTLTMQTSEVTNAVDSFGAGSGSSAGGVIPIGTPLARSYFSTDRGAASIEYLISVARAHLLARARCVNIDYAMSFENFIAANITLRKNGTLMDPRLPGTDVGGKIIAYSFGLENGAQFATITIGACVGRDGTQAEISGTPDYVDESYVARGYQAYSGQYNLPPGLTDVVYLDQSNVQPNDDGIDFTRMTSRMVKRFQLLNPNTTGETQEDALDRFTITTNPDLTLNIVNTRYAQIITQLPDLTAGPFETDYLVQVSNLRVPRTIDLEAPSEGASS